MAATDSTNILFEPKVWSDHVMAYFDKKLVYGAFAVRNDSLTAEGSGLTVNFPYYTAIGAAEEPAENVDLTVDNLSDDSFSATVFEVGKAVGFKKKAFKKSADGEAGMLEEAHRQIARVHAEKVDAKLATEIDLAGSSQVGFAAAVDADIMTVKLLLKAKVIAFGDKQEDTEICFMHSLQWLDLMTDPAAGFLKADANDPFQGIKGFSGRILNMAIIVVDSVPLIAPAGGITKNRYKCTFHKANSYGFMNKQDMEFDTDKDILARLKLITGNQWYAVKSFHAEVAALDYRAGSLVTTIS